MSGHGDGVETIAEVFKCFICMEWPKDARLCPHCSKLCCFHCIQRWLIEQRPNCPHCRASLLVNELVKCRWAEDVYKQVDKVRTERHHRPEVKERERCQQHHEELTVYCATCTKCICHKCALWGGEHHGHTFEEVDKIYKKHRGIIQTEKSKLWKRFLEISELVKKVERSMERVRAEKQDQSRQIQQSVDHILNRLDTQLKTKLQKLAESRNILSRKAEEVNSLMQELDRKMKLTTRSELISQGYEIQQKLMPLIEQVQMTTSTRDLDTLPDVGSFTNEVIPPYDSAVFEIKHFSRRQQHGEPVYSKALKVSGLTWRLKVYPHGNGATKGAYLSVFLELTHGFSKTSQYQYRIEMVYQGGHDESKNIVREFTSDFAVGECWGYNRFHKLDSLVSDKFINLATDTLVLRYSVHAPTYHLKCRDLAMYCASLEKHNAMLNRTIAKYEEKFKEELGKKKSGLGGHGNHRSQDIQEENQNHSSTESHHKQIHKSSNQAPIKRRQTTRDGEMRSKFSSSSITGSESMTQSRNAKNGEESNGFSALSLPSESNSSDHLSHESELNHKNKSLSESHDKNKQHNEAAENSSSKHENASSATEASSDSARHDREATPLATNANPKIVVGESDDGEISSGHSTPVPKPGCHSYEIDIGMSPATSTSTLTTVAIHSPPECNGFIDTKDQHHRRHPPKLIPRTDAETEGGIPMEYRDRDKYYTSSRQHNLQPPHDHKLKKRGSGEFQSLKELDETISFRTSGDHQLYNFNASPNQHNVHELSQVENFSQSSLPRFGGGKKRTSLSEFYNSQESPPSPRHFLSQSVMELSEQDEYLTEMSERSNLSRMSSEPYLGPIYDNAKYQHPHNYNRYSSGSAYSHVVPYSGARHVNSNRTRHVKPRERIPGRRHSGDNSHYLATGDKSNSTSSLSQPRRGNEV